MVTHQRRYGCGRLLSFRDDFVIPSPQCFVLCPSSVLLHARTFAMVQAAIVPPVSPWGPSASPVFVARQEHVLAEASEWPN